jgi:NhaP-type Na+/H+ or K+/H+ antiporter
MLASTDPVMLRGLLRRPGLPEPVRLALRLESGLNDVVLLPIVLVAMPFLGHNGLPSQAEWARIGLDLFLLGPGAGIAVGLLAIAALEMIRRKTGVRRDYESIYSLGVAFAAFAAAEAVHGSGFLAAFAAGLTIAALDVGAKRARCWGDGKPGRQPDYPLNRNRSSNCSGEAQAAFRLGRVPVVYTDAMIALILDCASPPFSLISEA